VFSHYRKAFAKAQKIEEILPMMAASQRAKMEKTPADERSMMFDMLKEMTAAQGDVKVLKETATKSGAELTLETKGETGTATLIKEGGAWKLEKESWRGK
jgi:hypothetical protein